MIPLHDPRALPQPEDNDEHLLLTWNDSWANRATANGDTAKLVAKTASSEPHTCPRQTVTGVRRSVPQDQASTSLVRKGRNGVTHTSIRIGAGRQKLEHHERGATG